MLVGARLRTYSADGGSQRGSAPLAGGIRGFTPFANNPCGRVGGTNRVPPDYANESGHLRLRVSEGC